VNTARRFYNENGRRKKYRVNLGPETIEKLENILKEEILPPNTKKLIVRLMNLKKESGFYDSYLNPLLEWQKIKTPRDGQLSPWPGDDYYQEKPRRLSISRRKIKKS